MFMFKGGRTIRSLSLLPFLTVFAALALMPHPVLAGSDEAAMCFGCHAAPGMVKTFKNGDTLSVSVNEKQFKGGVHGFLDCTGCHADISLDNHPSAVYRSKREFSQRAGSACRMCHPLEQLRAKPAHQAITKADSPPCSDCHGYHAVKKVSGLKSSQGSQYCLTCHKQKLSASIGGETVSLMVDDSAIGASVHGSHECTNCHTAFSGGAHPVGTYKDKREFTAAMSGGCSNCHPEQQKKFEKSIHFKAHGGGNLNAPLCSDCHGSHSVAPAATMDASRGEPCGGCHGLIAEAYVKSVHGSAKQGGNKKSASCSSCHSAHNVKQLLASTQTKEMCVRCHDDTVSLHKKWLSNAALHLEAVSCSACHVQGGERMVYIYVTDSESGKAAPEAVLREALGETTGPIEDRQLWDLYRKLKAGAGVSFAGKLGLKDGGQAHGLLPKESALSRCEDCHRNGSEFFGAVSLAVVSEDGTEKLYPVEPKALGSIFALLPLNQFYVLSSTRIWLLDVLGILMILGGASFPVAHITLRVLTRGIRQKRRK